MNKKINDLIELIIVLGLIFILFAIYVPVSIWEEERASFAKVKF
jgi:competence protein ComGC